MDVDFTLEVKFDSSLPNAYLGQEGVIIRQSDANWLRFELASFGPMTHVIAALPVSFGPERDPVLAAAACRLADLGARLHPDHRVDLVFDQVLRAPIPGQTHAERAWLAAPAAS